jgi:hypothetical protein
MKLPTLLKFILQERNHARILPMVGMAVWQWKVYKMLLAQLLMLCLAETILSGMSPMMLTDLHQMAPV